MKNLLIGMILVMSQFSFAGTALQSISSDDLKGITKDLGANFSHRSVSGAANMGAVFGFEAVALVGTTKSSSLSALSEASGGESLGTLAHAGALLGVSIPFGLTFEYIMFPSVTTSGAKISGNSMGLRYQMNGLIPILPVNLALKLNRSSSSFEFSQNVNGINGTVLNETGVDEVGLYLSPKMPVVEPYIGFSMLSAKGDLTFTGTGTLFDAALTTSNKASATVSGTKTVVGLSVWLPLFSVGVEYANLLGTSGYTAKLGMSF